MVPRVGDRANHSRGSYFGSILRVLAVFSGSIFSGYSGYRKKGISDACTAGAACVLGVLYTARHVPSTRGIWAFSTADTPSTQSIHLGRHNSRVPHTSSIQSIETKQTLHQVCTGGSIHYPQIEVE